MIKQLLKKQMSEMFQSFFVDKKKNKKRSKASTVSFIAFYLLLIVGFLGGMFTYLSITLCKPLVSKELDWLYYAILSMVALALGIFGSVFNTYSGLYLAKDNDLLLSMPIPTRYILISRLLSVYLMGTFYSSLVMIPAIGVYLSYVELNSTTVIGAILLLLTVTAIVMLLSCILGWVVAKISSRLKKRSLITVIVTLIFFGGYYFLYFKANTLINNIIFNAKSYGEKIKNSAYPLYAIGKIGVGDAVAAISVIAVIAVLFILTYRVISKSFLKLATTSPNTTKAKYVEKKSRVNSAENALIGKEMRKFFSNPNYILNCGMGMLLLPVFGIILLIKGSDLVQLFSGMLGGYFTTDAVAVMLTGIVCLLSSMNNMSAPSVSLEGKSIWISQSLPVTPWQILKSKFDFHFILTAVPCAFCSLCAAIALKSDIVTNLLIFVFPISFVTLFDLIGLSLNLKSPNLTWTNEVVPIKQSLSVFVSIFGGWIYAVGAIILYVILMEFVSGTVYLLGCSIITLLFALALFSWSKRKGSKIYAEL